MGDNKPINGFVWSRQYRQYRIGNIGHRIKVDCDRTQTVMIKKRIKQKELLTAFIYRSQSLHGAAESSRCTYMCENGPRSDRRVCVCVCMWVREWINTLSLFYPEAVAVVGRSPAATRPHFFSLRAERLDRKTVSRQIRRFLSHSRTDCLT